MSRGKMMAEAISFLADPRVEVPLLLILAVAFWYGNGAPLEFLGLLLLWTYTNPRTILKPSIYLFKSNGDLNFFNLPNTYFGLK